MNIIRKIKLDNLGYYELTEYEKLLKEFINNYFNNLEPFKYLYKNYQPINKYKRMTLFKNKSCIFVIDENRRFIFVNKLIIINLIKINEKFDIIDKVEIKIEKIINYYFKDYRYCGYITQHTTNDIEYEYSKKD